MQNTAETHVQRCFFVLLTYASPTGNKSEKIFGLPVTKPALHTLYRVNMFFTKGGAAMDARPLDERFAEGSEAALADAIALYGQPLLRYCHHILCDYHEAQDAVQTTFIKAYDNHHRFRAGTSLSAWLYPSGVHYLCRPAAPPQAPTGHAAACLGRSRLYRRRPAPCAGSALPRAARLGV